MTEERPGVALVVAIPMLFLATGLLLRYLALRASTPDAIASDLVGALCQFDCNWYVGIAENGYDTFPTGRASNVGNWGFFPLYPNLVALLNLLSPLGTLQNATLLSLALTFAACLVAWPLLGRSVRTYAVYSAYVLAGPFSYYFSTALTESLFLLLTSLAMLSLQRRAYLAAGLASALLSATRIVGVFFVFATVLRMLADHRSSGGSVTSFPKHLLKRPDLLFAIFLSPLGLFAFMLFLHMKIGDGFAFSNVQRGFGRNIDWPWLHWWDGAHLAFEPGWTITPPLWSAIAVVVALALAAVLAMRRQIGLALFCVICIVLPVSSGMASIIRYTATLAPLPMTLADLVARNWLVALAVIGLVLAACYVLTPAWIGGSLALV